MIRNSQIDRIDIEGEQMATVIYIYNIIANTLCRLLSTHRMLIAECACADCMYGVSSHAYSIAAAAAVDQKVNISVLFVFIYLVDAYFFFFTQIYIHKERHNNETCGRYNTIWSFFYYKRQ